jgi:plastocyanin
VRAELFWGAVALSSGRRSDHRGHGGSSQVDRPGGGQIPFEELRQALPPERQRLLQPAHDDQRRGHRVLLFRWLPHRRSPRPQPYRPAAGCPTAAIANGFKDARGNPFWFNGKLPLLGLNPQLFSRSTTHSYTGTKRLDSGLLSSKPFNVVFTKPGTYKFFCDVHPGMVGYVTVRPTGVQIPSLRQDVKALLAQETKDIKATKQAAKAKPPTRTIILGESAPGGVELDALFPTSLTVKAGTVVTFRMSAHSRETHTATFGPTAYLSPIASSLQARIFSPLGTYPSDPFRPLTLTPTSHGNGLLNTGLLDNDPATKQIRSSSKIDFTTPGTYHFVCVIHPFMRGTIVVK